MSELLKKLSAHIRNKQNNDIRVVGYQALGEDGPVQLAAAEPKQSQAKLETSIDAVSVGSPKDGHFAYFMDGMERQRHILYCSRIPVVYGYVAASIRKRVDRRMKTHKSISREALYCPSVLIETGMFAGANLDIVPIDNEDSPAEEHPMILLDAARKRVSNIRNRLEYTITSEWLDEFDGSDDWLLVDGSITGDHHKYKIPNIVGAIKSHQTNYFEGDDRRKILDLKEGERSGVFIPLGRNRPEVYSWYLRLRPSEGQDVHFGLIRVEAAKCARTLDMVDEISRWIMAERSPLSLPDSRWDRMIYPIRDCEQYLKSLAPSMTMIEASIIGMGASLR